MFHQAAAQHSGNVWSNVGDLMSLIISAAKGAVQRFYTQNNEPRTSRFGSEHVDGCSALHWLEPIRGGWPVHCWQNLRWSRDLQNWTTEHRRQVSWSDGSRFLSHHVDGHDGTSCIIRKRRVGWGSVMFCWDTLGPELMWMSNVVPLCGLFQQDHVPKGCRDDSQVQGGSPVRGGPTWWPPGLTGSAADHLQRGSHTICQMVDFFSVFTGFSYWLFEKDDSATK